ncbi:MAG: hypothetical protein AB7S38_05345 [Vulcanimicrobiota bacterium]
MENNLLPMILFAVAAMDVVLAPLVASKVPPQNRLIVGAAMLMGAVITGGLGLAFWMGWL